MSYTLPIADLPASVTVEAGPAGAGVFLSFAAENPAARLELDAGRLAGVRRFTCCHRYEPYWMKARAGRTSADVPEETQYLLAELEDGSFALVVPLLSGDFRCCLKGSPDDRLILVAESGDAAVVTGSVTGLFIAVGADPYDLLHSGARSVMARLQTGRLRAEKPVPSFVERFGWCTWDSFYQEVSHAKIRQGLESFRAGGIEPRVLIVDDGWQSRREMPSGEVRLTGFAADSKFPGDLAPTVQMAKEEFAVEQFLVWHALYGYWGGVDGEALPGYGVRSIARAFSPGILSYLPDFDTWWGGAVGFVAPEEACRFFQDYHRHLRLQGVDGVKVDTQCTIEGVARGSGGRVAAMRRYREALEGSVQTHFGGQVINCMSCAMEVLYGELASTVTRTSTDFWPNRPESHGEHLYVNAQVSAWFGEFVFPDWDMFQSGHAIGAFHAAGRAVGGCPVYVSDKPDAHNFDLLRKLVLPDGGILRALQPGMPTRDCLFRDPTTEDVLLKIFNRNAVGGVVGVFNARYFEDAASSAESGAAALQESASASAHAPSGSRPPDGAGSIKGVISPDDVEGLSGERFAVYAHNARELRVLRRGEQWPVALARLTFEIFTAAPIEDGIAPIGLPEMFNSGGAVTAAGFDARGDYRIALRAGGKFLAWCHCPPDAVSVGGEAAAFAYDAATGALTMDLPGTGACEVVIRPGD